MANTTEQALNKAREALEQAYLQIEYLHGKYQATGSGNAVCAQINEVLAALTAASAEAATPVYYSITVNGQHCGNFWPDLKEAEAATKRLNASYPQDSRAVVPLYDAAPQASQPIGQPESLGEWVDVTKRLPERGQRIQGLSRSGAWIETFDPDEPLGHMTHWRAVDDEATDSTEQPVSGAMTDAIENAARALWNRFAPSHNIEWEDEPHKAEYIDAARSILSASGQAGQSEKDA